MNLRADRIDTDTDETVHAVVEARAITWLVWLRSGEATLDDAWHFLRWRRQNREHERAVQDVAWLWSMLGTDDIRDSLAGPGRD
ncbi:MAG TPA: DUF4880 domain-containing protein [Paraburkholderia sp.]|jgi:ferric-dicitrate binding protein FerR (iron transport regulator)